jgi:hypothetical protein
VILLLLVGPPIKHNLTIKIHLGIDKQSEIIRSELANSHEWFVEQRIAILTKYNVILLDDEFKEPTWEISSYKRQRFLTGTFRASGTFILSLRSIIEEDVDKRQLHNYAVMWLPGNNGGIVYRKDSPPIRYPLALYPEEIESIGLSQMQIEILFK